MSSSGWPGRFVHADRQLVELRLGGLDSDPALKTRDHEPAMVATAAVGLEGQGLPRVELEPEQSPWHDADDLDALAVEEDGGADDVRIPSEAIRPEVLGEQHHPGRLIDIDVGVDEGAPGEWASPQHIEEARRDRAHVDLLRRTVTGERSGTAPDHARAREGGGALHHLDPVRHREGEAGQAALQVRLVDLNDLVRTFEGEWLDEDRVDHAEDRRVGTDPEGQHQECDGGEARAADHRPQGPAHIPLEVVEPLPAVARAGDFLVPFDPAEGDMRPTACLFGRHAGLDVGPRLLFDVEAHFLVHLRLHAPPVDQLAQAHADSPEPLHPQPPLRRSSARGSRRDRTFATAPPPP